MLADRDAVGGVTLGVTGSALAAAPKPAGRVDAAVFVLVDAIVRVFVDDELPFVVRGGVTR
jgi:hypothetical protein